MTTLGIFGGSFKPFHTGHFAKLAMALEQNDEVILFYTISKRDKAGAVITKEMSRSIYDIVAPSLKEEYGDKLKIKISDPTPIVNTFEAIADLKNGITDYDKITVYGSEDIKQTYITSIIGQKTRQGEYKEEKYYGTLYRDDHLRFAIYTTHSKDSEELTRVLAATGHTDDLHEKAYVRGTQIREFVQNKDKDSIINYLPNILSDDEKNKIAEILFTTSTKNQKGMLPFYVG